MCTCRRLQKRTAARRYKCVHHGVRSSPVPEGPFLRRCALAEGCKNEPQQAAISLLYVHASRGPFLTCPRRCALAEGCKNEPQQAGISACISGSVPHLSPEVCTCKRLQKRTAARRYKCMHLGVRSSPVPGGVHLQKAANTNRSTPVPGGVHLQKAANTNISTRVKCMHLRARRCALAEGCKNEPQHAGFHMSCSLLGDGVREVCFCGNGKCKDFAATPVVACVQMGEASKTRNATTKARRSTCLQGHFPDVCSQKLGSCCAWKAGSTPRPLNFDSLHPCTKQSLLHNLLFNFNRESQLCESLAWLAIQIMGFQYRRFSFRFCRTLCPAHAGL